MGVGEKV